jgi:periplasmic protein TonB
MKFDSRLAICAVASVIAHAAIARALDTLPPRNDHLEHKIAVRVITPPPPEPEKPPEEKPPEPPPPQPLERPKAQHVPAISTASVAKDSLSDRPAVVAETTDTPVYGWTMESTSTSGTGPAIPVGNTANPAAQGSAAQTKRLAEPVAAYEATKMPLPQGRCTGKYTEEARTAGIEGTVVLDLIVGEDGRVRDISVVTGLAHGLDQAAKQALLDCHFTPGEKDGKPVPVRVRGFKIKFVLEEAQ